MLTVIPVKEIVCMPKLESNILLGREFSINAATIAMQNEKQLILSLQKNPELDEVTKDDIYKQGILVETKNIKKNQFGVYTLSVKGINRVTLKNLEYNNDDNVFYAEYSNIRTKNDITKEEMDTKQFDIENMLNVATPHITAPPNNSKAGVLTATSLEGFVDILILYLPINSTKKQKYIQTRSLKQRISDLYEDIELIKQWNMIESEINEKVKESVDENQKNYYLKEKMKIIKQELGEEDSDSESKSSEYQKKLDESKMPKEYKQKVQKSIDKLKNLHPQNPETNVIQNYLDVVLSLPYDVTSEKEADILTSKNILDEDHFGLKDVKDAVLEHLAVMKLKKLNNKDEKNSANVICLVGPPGVGKTSFSKSIARSLKRPFSKISLGGVSDEAEIRGHRRTYVAAMPGRIIEAIIRSKVKNPVILLDEIDKLDSGYKSDPSSALLEVLDPSQNVKFEDHFVDFPYDLSEVFFICTANSYMDIPSALYDRLEMIFIDSYTELEKLNIAEKYLIKQVKGETSIDLKISKENIQDIISSYTREAGVRNLKRNLIKIARKVAYEKLEKNDNDLTKKISTKDIVKYLGEKIYKPEKLSEKKGRVGQVTGLAWTSVGGTTLEVQAIALKGDGALKLTGKLGDVMKESAQVAYSLVRSLVKKDFSKDTDIHLHFPEGATPKDGPSAGVTITTAILSVINSKKIRQDIAMTGEITLTGDVLAVGGIKEKVIAAHKIGVREVILPFENKSDTNKLPDEIKKVMKFHFAKKYEDIVDLVFVD